MISSISYWVHAESLQFHTECTQKTARTVLSIRRMSLISYWVCAGHLHFHTQYLRFRGHKAKFFFRTILSVRRNPLFSYQVYAEILSIRRKTPYLCSVWNEQSYIILCQVQSILIMKKTTSCVYSLWKRHRPAYTQYENGDVLRILSIRMANRAHTLLAIIKKILVPGRPIDHIFSV